MCFSALNNSAAQLGVSAKKLFLNINLWFLAAAALTNDSQDTHHSGYLSVNWEVYTFCMRGKGNKITLAFPEPFEFRFWLVRHLKKKSQGQINSLGIFAVRGVITVLSPKLLSIKTLLNLTRESPFESFSVMVAVFSVAFHYSWWVMLLPVQKLHLQRSSFAFSQFSVKHEKNLMKQLRIMPRPISMLWENEEMGQLG